jgi:hypothetical protein
MPKVFVDMNFNWNASIQKLPGLSGNIKGLEGRPYKVKGGRL